MSLNILCLCNPLLDISVDVNQEFLDKYGLKGGNAILTDDNFPTNAFFGELVANPSVQYIAGGSAMNTARVAAWTLQEPGKVAYLGAVGKDNYARTLSDYASKSGVDVSGLLEVDDGTPTGLCGVCIVGKERSMVANLAASNKFNISQMSTPIVQALKEKAGLVYASGFSLTVCPEAGLQLAQMCQAKGLVFSLNMSAPFIMQFFKDPLEKLLPFTNLIFCNEDEAKCLAQMFGWDASLTVPQIAAKVIGDKKLSQQGRQIVCFTQGKEPTVIYTSDEGELLVPVAPIDGSLIIDTNGAGDAFVGGFLAMLAQGKPLKRCAEVGNYTAGVVIQHSGCQYPTNPTLPAE